MHIKSGFGLLFPFGDFFFFFLTFNLSHYISHKSQEFLILLYLDTKSEELQKINVKTDLLFLICLLSMWKTCSIFFFNIFVACQIAMSTLEFDSPVCSLLLVSVRFSVVIFFPLLF